MSNLLEFVFILASLLSSIAYSAEELGQAGSTVAPEPRGIPGPVVAPGVPPNSTLSTPAGTVAKARPPIEPGNSYLQYLASGSDIILSGSIPMGDLFGFDRAPISEEDQQKIISVMSEVKKGIFLSPNNKDCSPSKFVLAFAPEFAPDINHYEALIEMAWKCKSPVKKIKVEAFNRFKAVKEIHLVFISNGKGGMLIMKRTDKKNVFELN
jgi:hypothetical protein